MSRFFTQITNDDEKGQELYKMFYNNFLSVTNYSDWFNFVIREIMYMDITIINSNLFKWGTYEDIVSFLERAKSMDRGLINI